MNLAYCQVLSRLDSGVGLLLQVGYQVVLLGLLVSSWALVLR